MVEPLTSATVAGLEMGRATPRRRRLPATVICGRVVVVGAVVATGWGRVVVVAVVVGGAATVRMTLGSKRPLAAVGSGRFTYTQPASTRGTPSANASTATRRDRGPPGRLPNCMAK